MKMDAVDLTLFSWEDIPPTRLRLARRILWAILPPHTQTISIITYLITQL